METGEHSVSLYSVILIMLVISRTCMVCKKDKYDESWKEFENRARMQWHTFNAHSWCDVKLGNILKVCLRWCWKIRFSRCITYSFSSTILQVKNNNKYLNNKKNFKCVNASKHWCSGTWFYTWGYLFERNIESHEYILRIKVLGLVVPVVK